ncbi:MAG: hypothetical protein ACI83B_003165 [Sediminicola sp.]|jgi:hypothetical protein
MKVLKIEDYKGFCLTEESTYQPLDKLDKTILLNLVNLALTEHFEIDKYDESLLKNEAHRIIYKSVSQKLNDLHQKREKFNDESDNVFIEEYEKYKV